MSKALALQAALRAAFMASPEVVALVPATAILDTHRRPPPSPCVVLGQDLSTPVEGNVRRDREELHHDVHIYVAEPSTEGCKRIMGALWHAIAWSDRPAVSGYHLADIEVISARVMRDPDGATTHGILTVRALIGGAV